MQLEREEQLQNKRREALVNNLGKATANNTYLPYVKGLASLRIRRAQHLTESILHREMVAKRLQMSARANRVVPAIVGGASNSLGTPAEDPFDGMSPDEIVE